MPSRRRTLGGGARADDDPRFALLLLLAATVVTHGWVLLNDGVYRDGWTLYMLLETGDWPRLYSRYDLLGAPFSAYFQWFFRSFPDPIFAYKFGTFLCVLGAAWLTYRIGVLSSFLTGWESLMVALTALTYPAYKAYVEISTLSYPLCYFLFLLGIHTTMAAEVSKGRAALFRWGAAVICFWTSFLVSSLLLFFYGFLLFFLFWIRKTRGMKLRAAVVWLVRSRWFLILLPVFWWVVKSACFKPHGDWSQYNKIHLDRLFYPHDYFEFVKDSVFAVFQQSLTGSAIAAALFGVLVALLWRPLLRFAREGLFVFLRNGMSAFPLIAFGLLLLLLGMAPYVGVRKLPETVGYATRSALLVALPMALILVGAARLLFRNDMRRVGRLWIAILCVLFARVLILDYVCWQARWARDRSVMAHLLSMKQEREISIFWIDFQIPRCDQEIYDDHEWICFFWKEWGREAWTGLDLGRYTYEWVLRLRSDPAMLSNPHNFMRELDPFGAQASLTVAEGSLRLSPWETAVSYWYHRFLAPAGMDGFLLSLTELRVQRLSEAQARAYVRKKEEERVYKRLFELGQDFMPPLQPGKKSLSPVKGRTDNP